MNDQNEDFGLSVTKIENKPDDVSKISNSNSSSFQNNNKNQQTNQKRKVNSKSRI